MQINKISSTNSNRPVNSNKKQTSFGAIYFIPKVSAFTERGFSVSKAQEVIDYCNNLRIKLMGNKFFSRAMKETGNDIAVQICKPVYDEQKTLVTYIVGGKVTNECFPFVMENICKNDFDGTAERISMQIRSLSTKVENN